MSITTGLNIALLVLMIGAGGLTFGAIYLASKYGVKEDDNKQE